MTDIGWVEKIRVDYARMFLAMSTAYLAGGITWETYVKNTEIAAKGMRQLPSVGPADENSGIKTSP